MSGQHSPGEPRRRLLSSPGLFHGQVGGQCTGETELGKHTTSSSYGRSPGWPEAGPLVLSHFLEAACQALARLGPSLTHSSSSSPEVFRRKCSFQEGLHSTCMNTVNTVWRSQGSSWACPKDYNFSFSSLAILPYFFHSYALRQSASRTLGFVGQTCQLYQTWNQDVLPNHPGQDLLSLWHGGC